MGVQRSSKPISYRRSIRGRRPGIQGLWSLLFPICEIRDGGASSLVFTAWPSGCRVNRMVPSISPSDLDRISEVLTYLCIGSYGAAEMAHYLEAQGITHAICLLEKIPESMATLPNLCLPMSDHGESDISQILKDAIPFIEGARKTGGRVLIFCALGVNRSPALAAGYLRRVFRFSAEEALARIVSSRPFVNLHADYLRQLGQLSG